MAAGTGGAGAHKEQMATAIAFKKGAFQYGRENHALPSEEPTKNHRIGANILNLIITACPKASPFMGGLSSLYC